MDNNVDIKQLLEQNNIKVPRKEREKEINIELLQKMINKFKKEECL